MQIVFTAALASLSRFSTISILLLSSAAAVLALRTLHTNRKAVCMLSHMNIAWHPCTSVIHRSTPCFCAPTLLHEAVQLVLVSPRIHLLSRQNSSIRVLLSS